MMYLVSIQSESDQQKCSSPILVSNGDILRYIEEHHKDGIIIIKSVDSYV